MNELDRLQHLRTGMDPLQMLEEKGVSLGKTRAVSLKKCHVGLQAEGKRDRMTVNLQERQSVWELFRLELLSPYSTCS